MIKIALNTVVVAGIMYAQAPPRAPSVSGVVINSANGQPVRKVNLTLAAKDTEHSMSYEAGTDGNGRFVFEDVAPGEYSIHADRPGFMRDNEGAPGAPPPSLKVEAGQPVTDVKVRLIPLGVITGRVLDEDGDPVRGAFVSALAYSYAAGKKELQVVDQVMANDRGEFRLFKLHPAKIYLRAAGRDTESHGRARNGVFIIGTSGRGIASESTTFFPSAPDAAHATPIELVAGAQLSGLDIRLRHEARYLVRGKLPAQFLGTDENNPGPNYSLQLISRGEATQGFPFQIDNENFTFTNVPPGSYYVLCTPVNDPKRLSARQPVEVVNSDVDGVTLNLVPPIQLSGVLRVEGKLSWPLETMEVRLQPTATGMRAYRRRRLGSATAPVKADGSFTFEEVMPDVYEVVVGPKPNGYLKSIRFGDDAVTNGPIDLTRGSGSLAIVLATDGGELEGTVKKTNGDAAGRVRVTLIAYGKLLGREDLSRSGFADEQGKFHLKNIAPGDYEIFAWEDAQVGAPQDPEFRKPFEKHAVAVKMERSGHQRVELTSISVKATHRADQ